mgnify:CR=1 FL=1
MTKDEQRMEDGAAEREEDEETAVRPAEFAEAEPDEQGENLSLNLLMDVGLPVRVEMGRARLTVEELLKLRKGSVVQLDRTAGEPVNLYVRDKCFARGEIVVADNNFAFRVTEVVRDGRRMPHPSRKKGGENPPDEAAKTEQTGSPKEAE